MRLESPTVVRCASAVKRQGRAALGPVPVVVRLIRAVPRLRAVGLGLVVVRDVRGHALRRHKVATLTGAAERLCSTPTGASGPARAVVGPRRPGAP